MTKELTDKTFVVLLHSDVRVWITEKQKKELGIRMAKGGVDIISVGDNLIKMSAVAAIISAGDIDAMDNRKRGKWLCDSGKWHARNDKCECLSKAEDEMIVSSIIARENCKLGCQ